MNCYVSSCIKYIRDRQSLKFVLLIFVTFYVSEIRIRYGTAVPFSVIEFFTDRFIDTFKYPSMLSIVESLNLYEGKTLELYIEKRL